MTGAPIPEGTDGKVYFIRHAPAMEQLRDAGHLRPNHCVSFEQTRSKPCRPAGQGKEEPDKSRGR